MKTKHRNTKHKYFTPKNTQPMKHKQKRTTEKKNKPDQQMKKMKRNSYARDARRCHFKKMQKLGSDQKSDIRIDGVDPAQIAAPREDHRTTPKKLVKENAFSENTRVEGSSRPNRRKRKFDNHQNSDVWFDGVDPALIAASREDHGMTPKTLVKENAFSGATKRVALDCEFVGVGWEGKENMLARASVVNQFGQVLLDAYVRPREKVVDYRTPFSGIRAHDLQPNKARPFEEVHQKVADLIKDRILIGHSLKNDMKTLILSHSRRDIRDTSQYRPFRELVGGRTPSLRVLTLRVLGVTVQEGEHDSVQDARAAMRLYMSVKTEWEAARRRGKKVVPGASLEVDKQKLMPVCSASGEGGVETKRQKFLRKRRMRQMRERGRTNQKK